jgi:hypothetical protein
VHRASRVTRATVLSLKDPQAQLMIVAHTPLPQTGIPTLFDNQGSDKRKRESAVPYKHIEPIRRDNRHRMEWSFGFTLTSSFLWSLLYHRRNNDLSSEPLRVELRVSQEGHNTSASQSSG